jgi:hypothetical protein
LCSGALVLMAMGDSSIQHFGWLYMLWPSLLLCLGLMLPISAATNWLRRNRQFDWPGSGTAAAASLHQKQQEWQQQQQKKDELMQRHAAVMLSDRLLLPSQKELSGKFVSALQRMLDAQAVRQAQQLQQQQEQASQPLQDDSFKLSMEDLRQRMITPQPRSPESSSGGAAPAEQQPAEAPQQRHQQTSTDSHNTQNSSNAASSDASSSSSCDASRVPSTSSKLEEAVRRRLRREADRKLEDDAHRQAIWGPCLPALEGFERKLQRLHEERLRRQRQQPAQQRAAGVLGAWALGLYDVLGSNSFDEQHQQQQDEGQQGEAVQAGGRPAWMYRWRSDISTVPGVGDHLRVTDSFAPDE